MGLGPLWLRAVRSFKILTGSDRYSSRAALPDAPAERPWGAPIVCGKCSGAMGAPRATTTSENPGVVRMRLRCPKCGYEWNRTVPAGSMLNFPDGRAEH